MTTLETYMSQAPQSEFDLKAMVSARRGTNYELHHAHLNRTLVKVLRTIGFDKAYSRAEGAYLYDDEGQDYLDFLSGYGVFNIGRNHPLVKQAIRDVLDMDLPNMVQMDCALLSGMLAERLTALAPPGLDAVFFCNSGTEAVEGAMKFARAATGKSRILAHAGAYHGLTFGALSATQNASFREGFGPLLPGVDAIPFGNLEALEAELKAGGVAAFIAEPVQGKGVNIPADNFFPAARDLCHSHGALFIMDEVQTGLGRTGRRFAHEHWNVEPDIMTLAKALSGGYVPCGAILTSRKIHQGLFSRLDQCVRHSTTFGRNNLAMACGLASLHVLENEHLAENAARRGQAIMDGVEALKQKHELIKEVRGKGLMIAVEFHEPRSLKLKMAWKAIHKVNRELFAQMVVSTLMSRHRILTHVAGHNLDVIKILPPLMIGDAEVKRFLHALDDVLHEVTRFPGPIWEFGSNLVKAALKQNKAAAV